MQDKRKQAHSSTNFYLAVAVLISAIGASIGYAVHKHYALQDLIQKNHVGDSWFLRFLQSSKTTLAPIERFLEPYQPVINFLFTFVLIEFVVLLTPRRIKQPIRQYIVDPKLKSIEKWTQRKAQPLKNLYVKHIQKKIVAPVKAFLEKINPFNRLGSKKTKKQKNKKSAH